MKQVFFICISALIFANAYSQVANAPLFRDPITDGAADPSVVYNRAEKTWWMLYTQRRANCDAPDVAYCYGTAIGIACSEDNGQSWYYRGTLDLEYEPGHNTYWAPDIIYDDGTYHLFVVFIRGARIHWGGKATLLHYTSKDLWNWTLIGPLELPHHDIIDPTILKMPDGTWKMWYKYNSRSYCANTKDFTNWTLDTQSTVTDNAQEGAKAFRFKGKYWLIADEWKGMAVYSSEDCKGWIRQDERILAEPSNRPEDGPCGAHGDVIVIGDTAYIFYFTHPMRESHLKTTADRNDIVPMEQRRSSLQVAELDVVDGKLIVKDRNEGVHIYLPTE